MSKYHAVRKNGYASQKESKRAWELGLLERAGKISALAAQVPFDLLPPCPGFSKPLRYIADFSYFENGRQVIEDVKGIETPVFKIKRRLMKQLLGIDVVTV